MKAWLPVLAAAACLTSCAGPLVRPAVAPAVQRRDALLILPGFGYDRAGGKVFTEVASTAAREGVDLYVAPFITRGGLDDSRVRLERFIRDERLDRYERLHVFAFIAGSWTLNPLLDRLALPNLASVVYDRSPFQERAPKIAAAKLRGRAWLRYGKTIFDVARTPYSPMQRPDVTVALLVESSPTPFIVSHAKEAEKYGPFDFDCAGFGQRYDDCAYLRLNHADVYSRFVEVWPEVRAFILSGRFSEDAIRTPPLGRAVTTVPR